MNLNDKNMFDELVRQKLEGYAEPPDLRLLNNIHSKKNRLLQLYGLYRILIITSAIGLGLLGSYYLNRYMHSSDQVVEKSALTTTSSDQNAGTLTNSFVGSSERDLSSPENGSSNYFSAPSYSNNSSGSAESLRGTSISNTAARSINRSNSVNSSNKNGTNTVNKSTTQKHFNTNTSKQNRSNANRTTSTNNLKNNSSPVKVGGTNTPTPTNIKAPTSNQVVDSAQSKKQEDNKTEKTSSACDVKFDYYMSYNDEANFTNFSDVPSTASFRWNFGDGGQSAQSAPNHKYSQQGNFIVTLTVTDEKSGCSNSYQKEIQVGKAKQQNTIINLKGIVREGRNLMNKATVELVKYNESLGRYESFPASTNAEGTFTFVDVKAGRYWLLAHAQSSGYVNTYWGGAKNIYDAPEIIINTNEDIDITGYNIDLLYEGNDQAMGDKGSNNFPDNDHLVLLLDEYNNVVAQTTVDPNGNVNFNNVPPGNYKMLDTKTGNSSSVSVDNGSFTAKASGIAMSPTSGSSSSGTNPSNGNSIDAKIILSPNPAAESVNVDLQSYQQETLSTVVLLNGNGTELLRKKMAGENLDNINIDISPYPPGIYYVMVYTRSGHVVTSQLMKNASSTTGNNGSKRN